MPAGGEGCSCWKWLAVVHDGLTFTCRLLGRRFVEEVDILDTRAVMAFVMGGTQ